MVEVIIAMLILVVGVLGLAGTTAYIVRQVTLADLMTERSVAFQTVVDRIQAMPFNSVGSGTDQMGVFTLAWTSAFDGPQNKIVTIVTTGPGVAGLIPTNNPQVVDTFVFRILRR